MMGCDIYEIVNSLYFLPFFQRFSGTLVAGTFFCGLQVNNEKRDDKEHIGRSRVARPCGRAAEGESA
jgi:hypothetical protein